MQIVSHLRSTSIKPQTPGVSQSNQLMTCWTKHLYNFITMSNKGGRPKDPVRDSFTISGATALCKRCFTSVRSWPCRMKAHRLISICFMQLCAMQFCTIWKKDIKNAQNILYLLLYHTIVLPNCSYIFIEALSTL